MGDLHDWNTEIHLGEKKLGERVQKDTSCQKWPFLRADCRNEECWKFWGEYVTDKVQSTSWNWQQVTVSQQEAPGSGEYLSIVQEN